MEVWGRSFEDHLRWIVDNGKDIFLWDDNWLGSDTLKNRFLTVRNQEC